jgi:hypothetical protein
MYVCMYVCTYLCLYVCTNVRGFKSFSVLVLQVIRQAHACHGRQGQQFDSSRQSQEVSTTIARYVDYNCKKVQL